MLNFRNRLLLLQFLTVILATLLLGGGSHLLFVSSIESLQKRHLTHLAREGALTISTTLAHLSQPIELLDMDSLRERFTDKELAQHLADLFVRLPEPPVVFSLLDAQGDEIFKRVRGQVTDNFFNYRYDPVVQVSRLNPNRTQVRAKLQDTELGEPTVRLAHTYLSRTGERFLGTLVVSIPLKNLDRMLIELARHEDASLAILSAQGELLTYHRPELMFQKIPLTPEREPTRHALFGEDLILVASPVPAEGWQVVANLPYKVFHDELNTLRKMAIVVCLMVTIFGALFSWKITSLLTRQIERLIEFAERVGLGDYTHQLPLDSSEEFNRLNNAFNQMVQDLERHRSSRDALNRILETVIDPLIVTDRQGVIIQINHAAQELFCCNSEKLLRRPLADLFPSPPQVLRRAEFSQGLLKARVNNLETTITSCSGDEFSVLFSSAPFDSTNEEYGVVCILKDITELVAVRVSREKALLQAEDARRRIDVLLRSVPDGLVVTDPLGNVLMMNTPAERMLGAEAEKQVLAVAAQMLSEAGAVGRAVDIPLTQQGTAELRVIQAHASEVQDNQGRITGLVMLLRDVSRERSMEQMKNEFISTAAHELRTPLTSILGYSELMLDPLNTQRFSEEEKQGFLQEILGRAETLARIIDDLLSISRIESGQPLTLERSPTDVSQIVRRVVEQFRLTAGRHRFELNLPGEERLVMIDSGRIQQALENLLANAVKYSEEDSLISVRGELHPQTYQIIVEDRGIGMTPEQVEQIFDKFYRVDYSNTKTSGLGIGMSIVRQIVDGHFGQIEISSELGVGTRVVVSLPFPN